MLLLKICYVNKIKFVKIKIGVVLKIGYYGNFKWCVFVSICKNIGIGLFILLYFIWKIIVVYMIFYVCSYLSYNWVLLVWWLWFFVVLCKD